MELREMCENCESGSGGIIITIVNKGEVKYICMMNGKKGVIKYGMM